MKNIIFLILLAGLAYKGWVYYKVSSVKPLHDGAYIVVYGRDSCGFTQNTIKELRNVNVKFEYQSIDDKSVANELHSRMESMNLDTSYYLLPVVDINNSIIIRPENKDLIGRAKSLSL